MDRKGLTGIVDAMFFIIIMEAALAVVVLADGSEDSDAEDASEIADAVMMGNITMADFGMEDSDGRPYPVPDLIAVSLSRNDGMAERWLSETMCQIFPRVSDFHIDAEYVHPDGRVIPFAAGDGNGPVSSYTGTYRPTLGGEITLRLEICRTTI